MITYLIVLITLPVSRNLKSRFRVNYIVDIVTYLVQAGEWVWSQWQDVRSPEERQLGRREDLRNKGVKDQQHCRTSHQ